MSKPSSRSHSRRKRERRRRRSVFTADLYDSESGDEGKTPREVLSPDSHWRELQYQMYLRERMRSGIKAKSSVWVDGKGRPVTLAERIVRFKVLQEQQLEEQQVEKQEEDNHKQERQSDQQANVPQVKETEELNQHLANEQTQEKQKQSNRQRGQTHQEDTILQHPHENEHQQKQDKKPDVQKRIEQHQENNQDTKSNTGSSYHSKGEALAKENEENSQPNHANIGGDRLGKLKELLTEYTRQRESEMALSGDLLGEIVQARADVSLEIAKHSSPSISLGDSATHVNAKTQIYTPDSKPRSSDGSSSHAPSSGSRGNSRDGHRRVSINNQALGHHQPNQHQRQYSPGVLSPYPRDNRSGRHSSQIDKSRDVTSENHAPEQASVGRSKRNSVLSDSVYIFEQESGERIQQITRPETNLSVNNRRYESRASKISSASTESNYSKITADQTTQTDAGSHPKKEPDSEENSKVGVTDFSSCNTGDHPTSAKACTCNTTTTDNPCEVCNTVTENSCSTPGRSERPPHEMSTLPTFDVVSPVLSSVTLTRNLCGSETVTHTDGHSCVMVPSEEANSHNDEEEKPEMGNAIEQKKIQIPSPEVKFAINEAHAFETNIPKHNDLTSQKDALTPKPTHKSSHETTQNIIAPTATEKPSSHNVYQFVGRTLSRSYSVPELTFSPFHYKNSNETAINDKLTVISSKTIEDIKRARFSEKSDVGKYPKIEPLSPKPSPLKQANGFLPDINVTNGVAKREVNGKITSAMERWQNECHNQSQNKHVAQTVRHVTWQVDKPTYPAQYRATSQDRPKDEATKRAIGLYNELTVTGSFYRLPSAVTITLRHRITHSDMRIDWGLSLAELNQILFDDANKCRKYSADEDMSPRKGENDDENARTLKSQPDIVPDIKLTTDKDSPHQNEDVKESCANQECQQQIIVVKNTKLITLDTSVKTVLPRMPRPAEFIYVREMSISRFVSENQRYSEVRKFLGPLLEKSSSSLRLFADNKKTFTRSEIYTQISTKHSRFSRFPDVRGVNVGMSNTRTSQQTAHTTQSMDVGKETSLPSMFGRCRDVRDTRTHHYNGVYNKQRHHQSKSRREKVLKQILKWRKC